MPRRKSQTAKEQADRFKREAQKRIDHGLPSTDDADAAVDAMIQKNIEDHGA
jgi:hypothetical protein